MEKLRSKLAAIFQVKTKSDLITPLNNMLYVDIAIGLMIVALLLAAFISDHELIVRTLILSVYTLCPMAALDLIRHINLVVLESNTEDGQNPSIEWIHRSSKDVGMLWLLPPIFSSFFIMGSFVDFCFYINHEITSEPDQHCNAGCGVSIYGAIVTGIMFFMTLFYIMFMARVYAKLPSLKDQ